MNMSPEWVIYTDNAPTAPALPPLFHPTLWSQWELLVLR